MVMVSFLICLRPCPIAFALDLAAMDTEDDVDWSGACDNFAEEELTQNMRVMGKESDTNSPAMGKLITRQVRHMLS